MADYIKENTFLDEEEGFARTYIVRDREGRYIMVSKKIDVNKKPTKAQIRMLSELEDRPIVYDEDCPQLSDEELSQFRRISDIRNEERKKQTVSLRLSPQAVRKAKSLGKGYTSVLSRILEAALSDNDLIKKCL